MPVYKYKSFEEARQALWKINPDESLESLSKLWDLAGLLIRDRKFHRGVLKFKSLEEANKHRQNS